MISIRTKTFFNVSVNILNIWVTFFKYLYKYFKYTIMDDVQEYKFSLAMNIKKMSRFHDFPHVPGDKKFFFLWLDTIYFRCTSLLLSTTS